MSDSSSFRVYMPCDQPIKSMSRCSLSWGRRSSPFMVSIKIPRNVRHPVSPSHLRGAIGTFSERHFLSKRSIQSWHSGVLG